MNQTEFWGIMVLVAVVAFAAGWAWGFFAAVTVGLTLVVLLAIGDRMIAYRKARP